MLDKSHSNYQSQAIANDSGVQDEMRDEKCEVEIIDVAEFLNNLKNNQFNYVDMNEINRRNNQNRKNPNLQQSSMNYSAISNIASSRLGISNRPNDKINVSQYLPKGKGIGSSGRTTERSNNFKEKLGLLTSQSRK